MTEKKEEKSKGLLDIFWMSVKLTIFIILLPFIIFAMIVIGGIFLPIGFIFLPIVFIACLLVLLS